MIARASRKPCFGYRFLVKMAPLHGAVSVEQDITKNVFVFIVKIEVEIKYNLIMYRTQS